MIAFRNRETNEIIYSPVCRRGNRQYARKKTIRRDEFLKALLPPPVPSQGCEGAAKKRSWRHCAPTTRSREAATGVERSETQWP